MTKKRKLLLAVREDGVLCAYLSPWGGRTCKVLNPEHPARWCPC